jgi:hypothetical protein
MSTCYHCDTELSYGECHIEGTVVACNACDWASPMMERRYLDLSPSKKTLANVAMTLDRAAQALVRAAIGANVDYSALISEVMDARDSLRYVEGEEEE